MENNNNNRDSEHLGDLFGCWVDSISVQPHLLALFLQAESYENTNYIFYHGMFNCREGNAVRVVENPLYGKKCTQIDSIEVVWHASKNAQGEALSPNEFRYKNVLDMFHASKEVVGRELDSKSIDDFVDLCDKLKKINGRGGSGTTISLETNSSTLEQATQEVTGSSSEEQGRQGGTFHRVDAIQTLRKKLFKALNVFFSILETYYSNLQSPDKVKKFLQDLEKQKETGNDADLSKQNESINEAQNVNTNNAGPVFLKGILTFQKFVSIRLSIRDGTVRMLHHIQNFFQFRPVTDSTTIYLNPIPNDTGDFQLVQQKYLFICKLLTVPVDFTNETTLENHLFKSISRRISALATQQRFGFVDR